jgi:hypothetical protein
MPGSLRRARDTAAIFQHVYAMTRAIVLVLLMATGQAAAQLPTPAVTDGSRADRQLGRLLAGLKVKPVTDREETPGPYSIAYFSYKADAADWPYGIGFAVIERTSNEVLWVHLRDGDYPIDTVRWTDFDGDGKDDLFFHAGFEDVSETFVYVNRVASGTFALSNFASRFQSTDAYALVLDLDGDGLPELVLPEERAPGDVYECIVEDSPDIDARREVAAEYVRAAGRYDGFNSTFDRDNLMMADKIRVVRLYGDDYWATDQFPAHLHWRIAMLERLKTTATAECRDRYDSVITYLRNPEPW